MKAIDLIFRETLTTGQFEMKSHVLVLIDEAGNEYSDTFSEVRHNGRFEAYQYNGMGYQHMQNLLEAIFLNKLTSEPTYLQKRYICINNLKKIKL